MNERALRVLEFNKIRELVKKYAVTKGGKELVENLVPYESVYDIKNALEETNEAYNLIVKKGNPPFEGLRDIREAIERARKGGSLTTGQLLYVGNMLRCTNNVKEYLSRKEEEESFDRLEAVSYTHLIPKFPAATRDIAVLVDDEVLVGDLEDAIKRAGGNLVEKITLFDIYKGSQIPEGKKSIAYAIVYRDSKKSLTDNEVNKVHDKILKNLEKKFDAQLR